MGGNVNEQSFKFLPVYHKAFEAKKKVITKGLMLIYPEFSQKFEIYTDTNNIQLGSIIMKKGKIWSSSARISPSSKVTTQSRILNS